jgi:uncharacterized membrane protein HdeD (DUF308 family)
VALYLLYYLEKRKEQKLFRFYSNTFNFLSNRSWLQPLFYGIATILIGLIMILLPEILIAFIASLFFIGGITLLYIAYKIRQLQKYNYEIRINLND